MKDMKKRIVFEFETNPHSRMSATFSYATIGRQRGDRIGGPPEQYDHVVFPIQWYEENPEDEEGEEQLPPQDIAKTIIIDASVSNRDMLELCDKLHRKYLTALQELARRKLLWCDKPKYNHNHKDIVK